MSQSDFIIRFDLRPGEAEAVESITASAGVFSDNEVLIARELADESLARGPLDSGYWYAVAEVESRIIGYVCWGPIPCTRASYDLYWIVVAPEYAGKGVGRVLMRAAEERISDAGGRKIYVETSSRPGYAAARCFYLGRGYSEAAVFSDFYGDGDDKIVYVKDRSDFVLDRVRAAR